MDRVMTRTARFLGVGGVASIVFGVILLFWPGISLLALTALSLRRLEHNLEGRA